jgi:predicted ATP-dependent Lon-type protease
VAPLPAAFGDSSASSDSAAIELGLAVVRDTLASSYIRPDEATKAQSKVKQKGRYTFIDKVKVRLVGNTYVAECVNFGSKTLRISDDDVHVFERLLTGGVWAQVEVEWDESDSKAPFSISQLTPIQLASFNLEEYRKLRTQFATEDWIDRLIRSMGYEPSQFSERLKTLFLLRLIPLCERNYNLVELGPRGTGKNFAVQELSPYAALLTGPTTVANLFGHMNGKVKGMVSIWDVVGFDEVADLQKIPKEVLTTMKTYCGLGSHLNTRDRKAVRRTVSGLVKIIHPHGEPSKVDLEDTIKLAIECRRRVKEQLKKMGSFEYSQTSFGYSDNDTGEEHFVGVPEQGGQDLIAAEPMAPGSVYTASVTADGTAGLYRLEVSIAAGNGKLKLAGGISGPMKESIPRFRVPAGQ